MTVHRISRIYLALLLLATLLGSAWWAVTEDSPFTDTSQIGMAAGSAKNTSLARVPGLYPDSFAALMYAAYR